jgi:putative tryptophan/tyrosine transport system substrate-binding protein
MHRREFIAALAGTVTGAHSLTLPAASAQQAAKVRRIGVLMGTSESTSRGPVDAFLEEMARLGWADGRNARFEQRWTNGDVNRASAFATELVAAQPDVILASTTPVTAVLHRETSTIPIVFAIVSDPVGSGLVAGLPRPGGNITGFTMVEAAVGGKWLNLLKEIAPSIKRAAFMFNPDSAPAGGKYFLDSFEAAPERWESTPPPCLYAAMPRLRPRLPLLAANKRALSSTAPSWPLVGARSFH